MERTNSFIKVWFWSRAAGGIPSDVTSGATSINTDGWVHTTLSVLVVFSEHRFLKGTPTAYFPGTSCPIGSKFGPHNIIINREFVNHLQDAHNADQQHPQSHSVRRAPLAFGFPLLICFMLFKKILGGDWAGNVYGSSGCPSTCIGKSSMMMLKFE
jgi:hypothetical protein